MHFPLNRGFRKAWPWLESTRVTHTAETTGHVEVSKARPTWPFVVALTAVAFASLHWAGLLGSLPLPRLLVILAACVAVNQLVMWRYGEIAERYWVVVGTQMLLITVVIYAVSWGPALAIGYLFALGEVFRMKGSSGWPLAFGASLIGIAGGQGAIALGWVHSYVPVPYVHGLAALSGLGLGFVMHLLASSAEAREVAERKVIRSEQRFRSLVQNADDVVMVLDAKGLYLYDSPASAHVLGYEAERLVGHTWVNRIHPADAKTAEDLIARVASDSTRAHRAELRVRHADGSWLWCDVSCRNLLDVDGRDQGLVTVVRAG